MNKRSNAWVDEALDALAAEDARVRPPARLETAVLRAFGEQPAAPGKRFTVRAALGWALVPAAAAAVFAVATLQRESPASSDAVAPVATPDPIEQSATTHVPAGSVPERAIERMALARPVAASSPARPGAQAGYVIVPEPYVDPSALHIVRVRMSRMALATLGMPILNPDADGLVDVEMLVGDDGVARSIRHAALVNEQIEAGGEP
jgi:hypothetical protein